MVGLLRLALFGLCVVVARAADAQQTFSVQNGACPSGSSYIGSGMCRSSSGAGFIASRNGICPSGTTQAGSGYCRTDGRREYLQTRSGNCPLGTTYAGAGYCRGP